MLVAIIAFANRRAPQGKHVDATKAEHSPTIAASGSILGVQIGSSIEAAHEKLDRLCESAPSNQKGEADEGEGGERAYWKFSGTEFTWLIAWANREGKIFQMSATLRADQRKPFEEVGDPKTATANLENVISWNVARPNEGSFRVVAKGPARKAGTIQILLLQENRR